MNTTAPQADRREFIDVVILVPLEEELLAVMEVFPSQENRSTPTSYRHLVDCGIADAKCLVVQQMQMGKMASNSAAIEITSNYDVGLLVCLGIAGSLSADMNLTDVCYSGGIMDVYDNSKTGDAPDGGITLKFSPVHFETPLDLTAAFNFIRTQPELRAAYEDWQRTRTEVARRLAPDPIIGRQSKPFTITAPKTMCGIIVCGSVSKSRTYNEALIEIDRKVLAIETESGGMFAAAKIASVPAITIRGISDYADSNKSALENETAGTVRTLAAGNAATFLKLQFQNPFVLSAIKRNKHQTTLALPQMETTVHDQASSPPDILNAIGVEVDQRLRELCPEYRLQSTGYKLPIPRAQRRDGSRTLNKKDRSPAVEIRTIIERQKFVMLDVPRTYPDQALPWMIAHDLLTTEIGGRQVIPLVVDGDRLSPPRSGMIRLSGYDIEKVSSWPGVIPVIIVDNCPLSSKTRMRFLLEEVERYTEAHFLFIARGNGALIHSSDVAIQFQVELFDICDISFTEIAHFVERNFQLSGAEAEVIAYRLQETFKRYELSAHPSYLATISNSTLAALINANRRSELIQLAVDGSLSFVVADDTSDVSLSRTTRSRFLQKFVRAIRVDGRSFTEAEIIQFTTEFAEDYDFDISNVAFINAFVERGILHFENGRAVVSLPYIESYLLARELLSDSVSAMRYFNFASSEFDYPTFDIYAELGPAEAVVKMVEERLDASILSLPLIAGREHSLMSIDTMPGAGSAGARFAQLHTQMQTAIDEVIAGKPASERKQQILDIRNEVRSTAAKESRNKAHTTEEQDANLQMLINCIRIWNAGLILINSAAEHLRAKTKQEMATRIIALSSRILDSWNKINSKVDFESVRQTLTSEEYLAQFCEKYSLDNQDHVKTTMRNLMGNILDLIKESFVTVPLLTVLGATCRAHQRVLGRSLTQVHPTETVEKLIRSVWLLETDPASGEEEACASVSALPRTPVLRTAICNHLVTSAYWNHSSAKDRKHIVAVADTAIRPFSEHVDMKSLQP